MQSPLIILGASTRALAQSAVRAGYEPWCVDLFADQDLRALAPVVQIQRYPTEFLRAIDQAPEAPWIYTGGLENYPLLIERMARKRRLLGNHPEALRAVRSPTLVQQMASRAGLRALDVRFAADQLAGSQQRYLVKPLRSAGGLAIRSLTAGETIPRRCFAQEHAEGESLAILVVVSRGEVQLLGATRQLHEQTHPRGAYVYAGSIGPLSLTEVETTQIRSFVKLFAAEHRLVGIVGIDCIRTSSGLAVVEINPRYTASVEILERATGVPALDWHCRACGGDLDVASLTIADRADRLIVGKQIVYATEHCAAPSALSLRDDWADVPHPLEQFAAGMPLLTVFAEGTSMLEVQQQLARKSDEARRLFSPSK